MQTHVPNLERALQVTQVWIKDLGQELGWTGDMPRTWTALRAVLHALRDQLTVEEAAHLSAQLPLIVRGVFYEGWRPTELPKRRRHVQAFYDAVLGPFTVAGEQRVAPPDPEHVSRAVFALLARHISAGEVEDIRGMLPQEIRALWPGESGNFGTHQGPAR